MKKYALAVLLFVVALMPCSVTSRICILLIAGIIYCLFKANEAYKRSLVYKNMQRTRELQQRRRNILRFNDYMHRELQNENCL